MPLVSVVILTKNRSQLLSQALESVDRQTLRDFEVVVVDDGSTDATSQIIQSFKQRSVQTIRHETSLGIIRSRQDGLARATGELVAFLDDDDAWVDERKLEKQAAYLRAHSEVVVCGGGIELISQFPISNGEQLGKVKLRPETDEAIRNIILFKNPFFTSTVLLRRQTALQAGGFASDGVDVAEDYDLWLRMGKLGKFYNFQEVFTAYRQPSYNKEKFLLFLRKQARIVGEHGKVYPRYVLARIAWPFRLAVFPFMGF